MYEYLQDSNFLYELNKVRIKKIHIKLTVLTFDEKPIKEIQGIATSGSISVNGNSAIRRTMSLTMDAEVGAMDVTNLDSLIAINKKVKVWVGLENPLKKYADYGRIIWFPQGVYILTSASVSNATTGCSISIEGKDKMATLDGTCGGTLPASVSFHEKIVVDDEGKQTMVNPPIDQTIREAVNHFGGEDDAKIIINDMEDRAKLLVKYQGDSPIRFTDDYSSYVISDNAVPGFTRTYVDGQDVGYQETDLTYPGELVLSAGETVVNLLDKIGSAFGNYEYFYDVWGRFIYQQKRNYLDISYTPIVDLGYETYIQAFSDTKYAYTLRDSDMISSINFSPKYEEIKNNFIVWGSRTSSTDQELGIRYHLAIDEKPVPDLAMQYMWCIKKHDKIIRYEFSTDLTPPAATDGQAELVCSPCPVQYEWREELYRQALLNNITSGMPNYYDEELIAEWRKLYDPDNMEWKDKWALTNLTPWLGWNPDVYSNPSSLDYWLDFIDSGSKIGSYSVNKIGRRTKVVNDTDVRAVYNTDVPDIVFIKNDGFLNTLLEETTHYNAIGQSYCLVSEDQWDSFTVSSTGVSAYEKIRELLYQNLVYNTSISISCIPVYYLEPNNILYIRDEVTGISGEYVITNFTIPLNPTGTMSITANEVLTRI